MKKSVRSVLAIILSLSICFGGMIMTTSITANAAVNNYEANLSLTAAKEGMVLLKNDNNCLPLASDNRKIALFGGAGAMRTGTTGTGAESNRPGYTVSVYDGLKNAGFTITSENWLQAYDAEYEKGFSQWEYTPWDHFNLPEFPISQNDLSTAANGTDTAIYVLRRLAGESSDRKLEKGDFLLDDNEMANLTAIANTFDKVILLLNTCGPVDMSFLDTITNIDSILYISLPGMEGGNAVASILTGQSNPCGKLSATWAKTYNDYPSAKAFRNNTAYLFTEDIYVGYRWFASFDPQGEKVAYPFGYGLSYTDFDLSNIEYSVDDKQITVDVTVKNTGTIAGKEVVQIYYGAPLGKLGKSAISLIAYQKTDLLDPGATQTVSLSFDISEMASYDDEGLTGNPSCYVLEAGDYPIYVGTSSDNAQNNVAGTYVQEALKVTEQLTRYVAPVHSIEVAANLPGQTTRTLQKQDSTADAVQVEIAEMTNTTAGSISYSQLLESPKKIDDYIGQFSTETLSEYVRLISGNGAGTAGGYSLQSGTPKLILADGVTGLNFDYTKSASYPCPTCLAQTFNDDLVTQVAEAVADQFITFGFDNLLAPGINIQQNPLCGRNFGYFSEDPLLSGNMGAAYVIGAQSKGIGATPKHFAANTKEDNRTLVDSIASERALREIYLKSFQITVEKSKPWSIMTSYNRLNGVETAERSDLINGILRGEWGFDGVVMTDWSNNSNEVIEKMAGCDLNTYGLSCSPQILNTAVANGQLSKAALQQAAKNILKWTMKSYQNYKNGIYAGIQSVYRDRPSRIQAEAFNGKSTHASDIGFEDCGDIGGGKNPTNTNQGKVLYYALDVELEGLYRLTPRVAAVTTDGWLSFKVDEGAAVETDHFISTGGWQTYADQPAVEIYLPSGSCELSVMCNGAAYNLNYFTLEPISLNNFVSAIQRPDSISVPYNTLAHELALPETVTVALNDGTEVQSAVTWNLDNYQPLRDGEQVLSGTIVPPENAQNIRNLLAYITIVVAENPFPVTEVQINNAPASLRRGESFAFTADVRGQGNYREDLIWSVNSYSSTITDQGVLTVAANESAKTLTITATSLTTPEVKHSVTIDVIKEKHPISATQTSLLFGIDYDEGSRIYGTEDCVDHTGGTNIKDFNASNWIDFSCNIEGSGTFTVSFRYASPVDKTSSMKLLCDNALLVESDLLASTGGWQSWDSTEPKTITLPAGEHTIRVQANGNNFNINYIEITPVDVVVPTTYKVEGTIAGVEDATELNVTLQSETVSLQTTPTQSGSFAFNDIEEGQYTLSVTGNGIETYTQSITVPSAQSLNITVTPIVVIPGVRYKVEGTIAGVEDATELNVTLQSETVSLQTTPTQSGSFAFNDIEEGQYTLSVTGNGIETYTQSITVPSAQSLNITVTPLAVKPDIAYGDVDGNGKVEASDALMVLKSVVGKIQLTDEEFARAELDGNEKVDAGDALSILKKVVGKINRFPIEEQ